MLSIDSIASARGQRATAALKYKPERVRLLLVGEAPPTEQRRYFYFENVASDDWLFRGVGEVLFGCTPDREAKGKWLEKLKRLGVFLIDLKLEPVDGSPLNAHVPDLVSRCKLLRPDCIILIKVTVYDNAYHALSAAGLPVVDKRIPFPSTGQQGKFRVQFRGALDLCGRRCSDRASA